MMQRWREDPDEYRIEAIERYLESLTGSPTNWQHSQYGRVLEALTGAAVGHGGDRPLPGLVDQAISALDSIRYALNAGPVVGKDDLRFWSHRADILEDVKKPNSHGININTLEGAVGEYLALPFRSTIVDRLLIDALLASEFAAYAERVHWAQVFPFATGAFAATKKRPLREYFMGRFWDALLLCLIGTAFWWASAAGLVPADWLPYAIFVLGVLYIASFVWTTVSLPGYTKAVTSARQSVMIPLSEMADTYLAMQSGGPLSVAYLRKRIAAAEEHGVRWPGTLHALLDDVEARSERL